MTRQYSNRIKFFFYLSLILKFLLLASADVWASEAPCDPHDVYLATRATPPISSVALEKFARQKDQLRNRMDVIAFGDSILEHWPEDLFDSLFPGLVVTRFGVGGDSSQSVLWRMRNMQLSLASPRIAIVIVGTNNLGQKLSRCAKAKGIQSVVNEVLHKWPEIEQVYLFGITPRFPSEPRLSNDISFINEASARVAQSDNRITYIPPPPSLFCVSKGDRFKIDTGCPHFFPDGVHLNQKGYEVFTQHLKNSIFSNRLTSGLRINKGRLRSSK